MSALEERSLDQLADMIYNVLWQDILEVFRAVRPKIDSEGPEKVKAAFSAAKDRFLAGKFAEHLEVRWGMNMCPFCNDDNIEKNGIAYVQPSGDGLEFNHCLNDRIGILYNLVVAKATMDSFVIGLGTPGQFNGMSFYWTAVASESMVSYQPMFEIIKDGQWIGTISFDSNFNVKYLPFKSMTASVARGANEPWTTEIPDNLRGAIDQYIEAAKEQIEVALVL
ncbi:MAG: hypothetical protein P1Q69_10865 [Candidatus Thorarchaeota archaeon]|nr:hypothetical protein [Candidatus Thorarchaeota archaeon]